MNTAIIAGKKYELKEIVEEPKKNLVWRLPEEGEEYYLFLNGEIYKSNIKTEEIIHGALSINSLCIKKEPLEHELLLRRLRAKYNQFHEQQDDVELDWNCSSQAKCFMQYCYQDRYITIHINYSLINASLFYFSTELKAKHFFEENRQLYSKIYSVDTLKGGWE